MFFPLRLFLRYMGGTSVLWTDYGRSVSCCPQEGSVVEKGNFVCCSEQTLQRNGFHGCQEDWQVDKVGSRLGKSASFKPASESARRSTAHLDNDIYSDIKRSKRSCHEKKKRCEDLQIPPVNIQMAVQKQNDTSQISTDACIAVGSGGGVFTSRLPSPTPRMIWSKSLKSNRVRVEDNRVKLFPDFAGCPDWVKPLMYVEYQVNA